MTDSALIPWLLAGIPLLGALVSLALWSIPGRLKISVIGWSVISLGTIAGLSGHLMPSTESLLPLYLLPLAAAVSILGQPVHEDHRLSWIMTLVCLGFGIGAITGQGLVAQAFLMALLVSIIVLLFRHHTELWPMSWWGIGSFGLGALCIVVTAVADPPFSSAASLLTCAVLLPLIPFHAGYLTALTRLPGGLPSFVVLLLPVVGLHGLATAIPAIPEGATQAMSVLALAGSLYGAIKALAQSRVRLLLAYSSLSFFRCSGRLPMRRGRRRPSRRCWWAPSGWRRAGSCSPGK